MSGTDRWVLLAIALVSVVVPYVRGDRESRRRFAAWDCGFWAMVAILRLVLPAIGVDVSADLLFGLGVTARALMVTARGMMLPAWRREAVVTALLAAGLYFALIPHVLRWPVDGDEPYYVLLAQSIAKDHDLDLSNQYRNAGATIGREVRPQLGDPVGKNGQLYSRHEPFLPLLLAPALVLGGLPLAVAVIALFAGLFVYSITRLLEDAGVSLATRRLVVAFVALGPPLIGYSTRVWPELPAAFFFCEALRSADRLIVGDNRKKQWVRLVASALMLSLLKIRFAAIAIPLVILVFAALQSRSRRRSLLPFAAILIAAVPFLVLAVAVGNPINIHQLSEFSPQPLKFYAVGFFGLLLDGEGGLLFQAPLFFLGLSALFSWRTLPPLFRRGAWAAVPYLLLLLPRVEWHGGWAPPLRYVVVFMPLFALAAAIAIDRGLSRLAITIAGFWTILLTVHAIAFPWRLFRLADGENFIGEWLSKVTGGDVSRLFPSYIRLNRAAFAGAIILVVVCALRIALKKWPGVKVEPMAASLLACFLAAGSVAARMPGTVVQFEDSNVVHLGGELYPGPWTPGRFAMTIGWKLHAGDTVDFRFRSGTARLFYRSAGSVEIREGKDRFILAPTGEKFGRATIPVEAIDGVCYLRVERGEIILDRIQQE